MKQYDVTIVATVRKTIRVEASNEDAATEEAHGLFHCLPDENGEMKIEKYKEEIVSCVEVA